MDPASYYKEIDHAYATLTGKDLEVQLLRLVEKSLDEVGPQDPFYGAMLNELGGYYRGQNRFTESEQQFLLALEIFRAMQNPGINLATTLNNLAGTHRLMGNFDAAKNEFTECLSLYANTVGTNDVLYASALNNLSLVCLDQRDLHGAEQYLSEASAILSHLPQFQDEYASSLCNLANLHYFRKEAALAQTELEQAIQIHENVIGTRTPHYHSALHTLGVVLLDQGKVKDAYDALCKGANAANDLYGAEHDHTKSIAHMRDLVKKTLEAMV